MIASRSLTAAAFAFSLGGLRFHIVHLHRMRNGYCCCLVTTICYRDILFRLAIFLRNNAVIFSMIYRFGTLF
jgi:hypothetical protein